MNYINKGLKTERLDLAPLSLKQLQWILTDIHLLEESLSLNVSPGAITDKSKMAIEIKISRMLPIQKDLHDWFTYWLLIIHEESMGVGLSGFKGTPNNHGEVEIGYGIDQAYRSRGLMTEAVKAQLAWSFEHPDCKVVTASRVFKQNIASIRVLEKVGMTVWSEADEWRSWRLTREEWFANRKKTE